MKSDLDEMLAISKKFRDDRDWKKFHNPKDLAMDLSVEAAEVLEHFMWLSKDEIRKISAIKKREIADEISDVLNPLLLLADTLKINILESFKDKMRRNSEKYPVSKVKGKHTKYTNL